VKLSKYFDSEEFECSCCGLMNIELDLILILNLIRDVYGSPMLVTSGSRCSKHNKAVGGSKKSDHLTGKAVDIYCSDAVERRELVRLALATGMPTIGVKKDCLHFSIGKPARIFTYDK